MNETNIIYKSERPDFTIQAISGTSTSRGYHETNYEIVSRQPLDAQDLERLSACGLLGIGQAYSLLSTEPIRVPGIPTLVNKWTGAVVPGPCIDWAGREITKTIEYDYVRYVVRRICDSGD